MRVSVLRIGAAVLIIAGLNAAGPSARARNPVAAAGGSIAVTGATVVVGNGQVLQNATVVVQDGVIRDVGPSVAIPPDVQALDARGLFVYPGLIDAMGVEGVRQPQSDSSSKAADTDSAVMFPYVRAAELFDPAAGELASWREAGVLTMNVAPGKGVFMGQTALVIPGADADRLILKPSAAMRMSLQGTNYRTRRRGIDSEGGLYPTRLIGVLALIRQTLLDARHQDEALAAHASSPQAMPRPAASRSLDALIPVTRRTMPLMFPAETERDVQRVLDIADEIDVSCFVVGGYEAAELAAALKARNVPVLVSLNFPKPDTTDVHPQQRTGVEVLRFREHAPKAAAELTSAGVRVAFASSGLRTGHEFLRNLRLAVRQGLPKDAALRASTLSAAEILGVDRQVGSVQAGKIANLVIADGDLFADRTAIRSVIVAGRLHEVPAATSRPSSPPADTPPVTSAPLPAPPAPEPRIPPTAREVLIRNATIMTVTHGTIRGGSILIRDGKIAAVGQRLTSGPDTQVFDATGQWITPGLVDIHEHIPTDAHNEASLNVTAQTRLKDNLNPRQIHLYRTLAAGVTTLNVLHGSVNPIGGQNQVIKCRWGKDAHGLLFEGAPPNLKMAVEEFSNRTGTPASLMGEEVVIRDALHRAQRYRQEWRDYEARRKGLSPSVPLLAPRRDLAMDALVEVLDGKSWVHAHAMTGPKDGEALRGMLMLMRLADEFGFRLSAFHHAPDAFKIAPELARHGTGASIFGAFGIETPYNAVVLTRKGVTVSVNSDGPPQGRDLNQQAGMLMKTGLTEDEALALVTLNPARQIGVDKRVGSIEVGKDADLTIWTHYPLGFAAVADKVFIDGQLYFSREYDAVRQKWLDAERVRLLGTGALATQSAPARLDRRPPEARPVSSRPGTAGSGPSVTMPPSSPRSASGTYVIQHARVVTVSGPTLPDASVVIQNGTITNVATTVTVPAGATVVEGRGLTVYPGLFDPNSSVGMTASHPETLFGPFTPQLDASTSFIFDSDEIPIARETGITHILARPARGIVPGQGELMHLAGWTGEQMLGKKRAALLLQFPSVGDLQYTEDDRFIVTPWSATKAVYDRRVAQLKDFFTSARAYVAERAQHAAEPGWVPRDDLEAMIPVLTRQEVVIVEAANVVDIQAAVQFAQAERLNYVLGAPVDAWRVADFLKANNVRVVFGSTITLPEDEDAPYDIQYRTPAILHEKGVPFAFSTAGGRLNMPRLYVQSAANAVAYGLPSDVALRAMTLTPAEFLGLSDELGSVEKGKIANLVVTAGDLFDAQSILKYVFVNGEPVDLKSREVDLFEKYLNRPALKAAPEAPSGQR
jgi:imidazolonepropionase-like amidohydrolase